MNAISVSGEDALERKAGGMVRALMGFPGSTTRQRNFIVV